MRLGPGALVWAGWDGPTAPGALLDAIRAGAVGGVVLFAFRGNLEGRDQLRAMIGEVQGAAARGGLPPVPVAVDQEGGSVVRVGHRAVFPSAMAIAATGEPSDAERAARAVALGLRADGITVNLAPVCDVNVEPRNPVIGTRSFGDDAPRVAGLVAAWVRGSESAGVASAAKHFPGHGATAYDTHVTTADVNADRATIEARELVPFRAAILSGVPSVVVSHVRYPALDPDEIATFSAPIATALLRRELGFAGLCLTDDLDMSAARLSAPPGEAVSRAIRAGVDAAMVMSGLAEQLETAERITTGVPAPRVLEALRRAAAFRTRYADAAPSEVDDAPARALAADLAGRAITAPRGAPPHFDRVRIAYFAPSGVSAVEELRDPAATFEAALRGRFGDRVSFARDAGPEGDAPLVICTSSASFDPEQRERARALLATAALHCALRSPYDALLSPDHVPVLLTYGDVPVSLEALAAVLAGAAATGTAPIRILRS